MQFPVQNPNADLTRVKEMCDTYVNDRFKRGLRSGDSDFIFDELMMALYGPNIFSQLNKLSNDQAK
jgi:hypothetical protein